MYSPEITTEFDYQLHEGLETNRELIIDVGDGCEELFTHDNSVGFIQIAYELVKNCAEKGVPQVRIKIKVSRDMSTDKFKLVVGDDVKYDAEDLQKIVTNLNSPKPERSGKLEARAEEGGRIGINVCRRMLERFGGQLEYKAEDSRVVAIAEWQRECFLNPLPLKGGCEDCLELV